MLMKPKHMTYSAVGLRAAATAACLNFLLLFASLAVHGDEAPSPAVRLKGPFGDNMVIQRDRPIRVLGSADPGAKVTVTFAGSKKSVVADENGDWKVVLEASKANPKPQDMQINDITLSNILIGDVWHGSGQSNMEMTLGRTEDGESAGAGANFPRIRFLHVPQKKVHTRQDEVDAVWKVCSPESAPGFSAVLYYFGRTVHREVDVPIGLIDTSVSGSCIDPYFVGSWIRYNGMIHPLTEFGIKGFLWYQGESNVKNGLGYFRDQKQLVEGWRKAWGDDNLPFYFVQLAPLSGNFYPPGSLPVFWEAQAKSLAIPNTGMVVITDLVPDITALHPVKKQHVGERLARWALVKDYGKKMVYSGPLYKSMKLQGDRIVLSFAHTGSGLTSRDGKPLNEFQVAGTDGHYVAAKAKVSGNTVVVWAETVKNPKKVRFGWRKTAHPNLINKEGLPASPFHTDGWQGATGE